MLIPHPGYTKYQNNCLWYSQTCQNYNVLHLIDILYCFMLNLYKWYYITTVNDSLEMSSKLLPENTLPCKEPISIFFHTASYSLGELPTQ